MEIVIGIVVVVIVAVVGAVVLRGRVGQSQASAPATDRSQVSRRTDTTPAADTATGERAVAQPDVPTEAERVAAQKAAADSVAAQKAAADSVAAQEAATQRAAAVKAAVQQVPEQVPAPREVRTLDPDGPKPLPARYARSTGSAGVGQAPLTPAPAPASPTAQTPSVDQPPVAPQGGELPRRSTHRTNLPVEQAPPKPVPQGEARGRIGDFRPRR